MTLFILFTYVRSATVTFTRYLGCLMVRDWRKQNRRLTRSQKWAVVAAQPSARLAAAEALLARGWGKPRQGIEMSIESVPLNQLKPDLASNWNRAGDRPASGKLLESPHVVEEEGA